MGSYGAPSPILIGKHLTGGAYVACDTTMTHEHLTDNVESDPGRNAAEKETTFTMLGDEKEFRVFSAKRTIVKSLLKHPECDIDWVTVERADGTLDQQADPDSVGDDDAIYALAGTMPVGTLTVKSKPRANNNQSSIVNAEGVDPDAFSN